MRMNFDEGIRRTEEEKREQGFDSGTEKG